MDLAQILTEEIWRMELLNNDNRFLLVATSHRNITSISSTLVQRLKRNETHLYKIIPKSYIRSQKFLKVTILF